MNFLSGLRNVGSYIANPGEVYGTNNDIGNVMNSITGVNSQMDKSYSQQKAAMELQNQYNKEMWNLQNAYNSPSAQLARMADAGIEINPTAYALGSSNLSNTAGFVGSESGFSGSGSPAGNPISALMGIAQGVQGIREARSRVAENKARVANLREQNVNIMEQGNILFNQMEGSRIQNEIARHNLQYGKRYNKPVGYVPTIHGDPIGYVGGLAGDYVTQMIE